MTYDIETIKRLVPEASEVSREGRTRVFSFKINGLWYYTNELPVKLLLDTRLQLGLAREGLGKMSNDRVAHRYPNWSDLRDIARDTLAAIEAVK